MEAAKGSTRLRYPGLHSPSVRIRLLVAAALLAACGTGSSTTPSEGTVVLRGFAFQPQEVTVSVGDTVTWSNQESGVAHTTSARGDLWDSGVLQPGDFFQVTFDEPGEYPYFCAIHPTMQGVVRVEE